MLIMIGGDYLLMLIYEMSLFTHYASKFGSALVLKQDDKCSFRWGLRPQGGCSRSCGGGTQVLKVADFTKPEILRLIERLIAR